MNNFATVEIFSDSVNKSVCIKTKVPILLSDFFKQNALDLSFCAFDLVCGGKKKCMQCKIIATGNLSPVTSTEKKVLSSELLQKNFRLACFTTILGDSSFIIPSKNLLNIQTTGKFLPIELKEVYKNYAVAVDIGTTTIVASLLNNQKIHPLFTVACKNPQIAFGSDILSRLSYTLTHNFKKEMSVFVQNAIKNLIFSLCQMEKINFSQISVCLISANTSMLYLLTQKDPTCIVQYPFENDFDYGSSFDFDENEPLKNFLPKTSFFIPKCFSSFVGADTNAALICANYINCNQKILLIDIGTNTEIALFDPNKNELICSSTAAGPAFEGANISCGMYSANGAIFKVDFLGHDFIFSTIGGEKAIGICGSGLIDCVVSFLQTDLIDETGTINEDSDLSQKIFDLPTEEKAISLVQNIYVSQNDIRQIQLAKASVCAGIQTVLDKANCSATEIHKVYIAGGFGSNLNISNCIRLGLLPKDLGRNVCVLGNACLTGSVMCLQNKDFFENALSPKIKIKSISLSDDKDFSTKFIQFMDFKMY